MSSMKRFLRFDFSTYYPSGGALDFTSSHDTLAEAQASILENGNASILDQETGEKWMARGDNDYGPCQPDTDGWILAEGW